MTLREYKVRWLRQFGGGMVPFDTPNWKAQREGATIAEAQREGVIALLDEFVKFVERGEKNG